MAAGNCHAKFNWGQLSPIWVNGRLRPCSRTTLYHIVTVCY